MSDRLIIEIGEEGLSDVVLLEVRNVAREFGVDARDAAIMLIGMGLAAGSELGMFKRVTPIGTGLDPDWRAPASEPCPTCGAPRRIE